MIEIRSLENTSLEQLHSAFNKAFEDYAESTQKTIEDLQYMLQRRGYSPLLSFGAFDNDELVSFTLNGAGEWNGLPTAYDTGTGTVKAYRNQGLASGILKETIPALQKHNISQYLLEVIRVNMKAADMYRKIGFEVSRELDYYILAKSKIDLPEYGTDFEIREVHDEDWDLFRNFWDFEPSWQNSIDAIKRKREHFKILAAYDGDKTAGYGIVEPHTGDIPQLAVAKEYRRHKVAHALMNEMVSCISAPVVKVINSDASYAPFRRMMHSMNIIPGFGQYEMIRRL